MYIYLIYIFWTFGLKFLLSSKWRQYILAVVVPAKSWLNFKKVPGSIPHRSTHGHTNGSKFILSEDWRRFEDSFLNLNSLFSSHLQLSASNCFQASPTSCCQHLKHIEITIMNIIVLETENQFLVVDKMCYFGKNGSKNEMFRGKWLKNGSFL